MMDASINSSNSSRSFGVHFCTKAKKTRLVISRGEVGRRTFVNTLTLGTAASEAGPAAVGCECHWLGVISFLLTSLTACCLVQACRLFFVVYDTLNSMNVSGLP